MTRLRTGHSRVQIPAGARGSSFLQNAHIGPVVHPTSFSLGTGILSRGKWPAHDVDNSNSHSAEGKNERTCAPIPPYMPSWHEQKQLYFYINKIQQHATVCRCLFTAKLLYMFRVSIAPIIRNTSNCNCSFWYRS